MKPAKSKRPRKADLWSDNPLEGDLTEFIRKADWTPFSQSFEFVEKDKTITLRISDGLLKRFKALAKKRKVKYQALIREAMLQFLVRAS